MNDDKNHGIWLGISFTTLLWNGIIPGIVSALLISWFIEPISLFVLHRASSGYGIISTWIADKAVRAAARNDADFFSEKVLALQLAALLGLAGGTVCGSLSLSFQIQNLQKRKIEPPYKIVEMQLVNRISKLAWLAKTLSLTSAVVFVVLLVSVILQFLSDRIVLESTENFRQSLAIVRPKISADKEIEYKAEWASMRVYEDYLKITAELQQTAAVEKLELPNIGGE